MVGHLGCFAVLARGVWQGAGGVGFCRRRKTTITGFPEPSCANARENPLGSRDSGPNAVTDSQPASSAAQRLLSAAAVRERARQLLRAGLEDRLGHFTLDLDRLDGCADEVVATIRANYPELKIPFHARWRHFSAGGVDRWGAVAAVAPWSDGAAMARAAFDLAIVSVLLDAGAGPAWRYHEGRTGETFARSEGLAVASFDLFVGGAFSSRPDDPFRVDADALMALSAEELARGFQVGTDNPVVGLVGRAYLLNPLGH